ncbi:RNA polymerase sigma factor [Mucilaginibacter sp. X4EP1]|uniref:RNA polymerase sigma factor n=1 Tax=Mucilaginibacter sp. X4EP1 TaxID=2723092 RepID=UPI002169DB54|nr:sigma-70 family RNA polymerase sigma factor [Mucilaginibacter sp. X4EP1]MCS3813042.1 RNA polymerase sigma-70 factor (ECF subfamily) [Mucilaginibacter sp. X4EP1]
MMEGYLNQLLNKCIKQNSEFKKNLYKKHYNFSLSICLRYASNRREAVEIMNLGYYKFFSLKVKYDKQSPFKAWLADLMINTTIEQYRAKPCFLVLEDGEIETNFEIDFEAEDLEYSELLAMLQQLPEGLRIIYNLYAIDGYSIQEICNALGTSEAICNLQLFRARRILKQMIMGNSDSSAPSVFNKKLREI